MEIPTIEELWYAFLFAIYIYVMLRTGFAPFGKYDGGPFEEDPLGRP